MLALPHSQITIQNYKVHRYQCTQINPHRLLSTGCTHYRKEKVAKGSSKQQSRALSVSRRDLVASSA